MLLTGIHFVVKKWQIWAPILFKSLQKIIMEFGISTVLEMEKHTPLKTPSIATCTGRVL